MAGFLRQSTASQSRALGPFIDDTDFVTPETGLTIANTDIKLVANGAASANKNSGGATHRVNGIYGVTFDATDTAAVGELEVSVNVSGALIVFDTFTVVEEVVYDALYAASATGVPTGNENADALLARNVAGGSSSGRLVKEALYFLRNKWTVATGTLTVYQTDDTTSAWTASVSSDASADPIVGNDPS